jgi:RimJ/RimL family protein N-acetyltransferase
MGKLTLVPFSREYLDRSWDWLRDPEIKAMTMAGDFTREDQERFFEGLPGREDYKIWGVESGDGAPIGVAGLKYIHASNAEFWCYIGERSYWGQGLGGRILEECEAEARKLGIDYLRMIALENNERSIRAYEKMGFAFVSRDDEAGTVTLDKSL